MNTFLEILLVITAFISVIPVVKLSKNQSDKKYLCLKFLIYTAAFWTVLIFIERTISNMTVVYYIHLLGFPTKFLLASLMLCTIFQYIEKKLPVLILGLLGFVFLGELVLVMLNNSTLWFINQSIDTLTSFEGLYDAAHGPLFLPHLIFSYGVLLIAIIYMFIFLTKHRGLRQYKPVTRTMIISVILVLGINLLEFLVIKTYVDLTYISLIFASHSLYIVIYSQDMVFNLRTSGRGEILYNMREIYVLTDQDKRVVDISPTLLEKYHINETDVIGKKFSYLVSLLEDKVVLYQEHNMDIETDETKDHYHLREKEFKINGMNVHGYMVLMYDETQVYKLLRELNHLSNFDMMTGLHNRNYMEYKLAKYPNTHSMGIISLDLNGLKINNDYLGHERGDYILKKLADNIKDVMGSVKEKEIARIGGDEFLIVVPQTTKKALDSYKKKILSVCMNDDIEELISVSLGIAFNDTKDLSVYQLVHEADQEMYIMKDKTSPGYKEKMIEHIKMQNKYIR